MAGHKTVKPIPGAQKWEGSKADNAAHDKNGIKEGSKRDIAQDSKHQAAYNRAAKSKGKGK